MQGRAPWSFLALAALGMAAVTFRARRDASAVGKRSRIRLKSGGLWKASVTLVSLAAFLVATTPMNVSAQTYDPVFYYYHPDHLGSTTILTDRSGDRVDIYQNTAFGREQYHVSTGAFAMSNRFTGQILDDETGLYYYNARYYDPEIGRFIQPDTIVPSAGAPQTLNRYSYCGNNPTSRVDPTGHFWGALIAGIVIAAVVGAGVGAAVSAATGGDPAMGALTGAISGALVYAGGILGGAAAGAINAELTGRDPGLGALTGAIAAGISGYAGTFLNDVVLANVSNVWVRSAIDVAGTAAAGVGSGAATAAVTGDDIGQAAAEGAATGAVTGALDAMLGKPDSKPQGSDFPSNMREDSEMLFDFGKEHWWQKNWNFFKGRIFHNPDTSVLAINDSELAQLLYPVFRSDTVFGYMSNSHFVRFFMDPALYQRAYGIEIEGSSLTFHADGSITHNFRPIGPLGFLLKQPIAAVTGIAVRGMSGQTAFANVQGVVSWVQAHSHFE